MAGGRWPDRIPIDDPLIASFGAFLALERNHSGKTVTAYTRDLADFGRFVERAAGGLSKEDALLLRSFPRLRDVQQTDVRRFIMECTGGRQYAETSVLRKVSSIRQFYRFLRREGIRADDPTVDLPRLKKPKKLPHVLNEADVERILNVTVAGQGDFIRLRDRAIKECLYGSGVRRAELVGVNLGDVDIERRIMAIRKGKGAKDRVVLLSEDAADAMKAYLGVRPRTLDEAFFLSNRKKRISESAVYDVFRAHLKISGVTQPASPHTMRHSFGTHMVENGADLMTVKELLGHESLTSTQIYTNISVEHMRKTFDNAHPRSGRRRNKPDGG